MLLKAGVMAVSFVAAGVNASPAPPASQLELLNAAGNVVLRVYPTQSYSIEEFPKWTSDAADVRWPLVEPVDAEACEGMPALAKPSVVLLDRGTCSYYDKIESAREAGAEFVLIAQSIDGMYNQTSGRIKNTCYRDCSNGRGATEEICLTSSAKSCGSRTCIALNQFEPEAIVGDKNNFCCMVDALQPLGGLNNTVVPSAFVTYTDANLIRAAIAEIGAGATVRLQQRATLFPNPSVYAMWIMGTGITAFASYHALSRERRYVRASWGGASRDQVVDNGGSQSTGASTATPRKHQSAPLEVLEISTHGAVGFLVMSCFVLVGLFYLTLSYPHTAVIALNVLYAIGSVGSLSMILFQPIFGRLLPFLYNYIVIDKPSWELKGALYVLFWLFGLVVYLVCACVLFLCFFVSKTTANQRKTKLTQVFLLLLRHHLQHTFQSTVLSLLLLLLLLCGHQCGSPSAMKTGRGSC
jgi:hypothetical protein